MRQALRHFLIAVLAAFSFCAHAATFTYKGTYDSQPHACADHGGDCGYISCAGNCTRTDLGCPGLSTWDATGLGWKYDAGLDTQYCWHISPTCPSGQILNSANGHCETPQSPTCEPGQHVEYNQCVPDNCPSGQAWNTSKNSCYPTSPPPDTSQPAPTTYLPVGTHDPNDPNRTVTPLPGLSTGLPANCGGWQCTYSTGEYDPAAGCWDYPDSPGITHCGFKPTYTQDAEGNPIPYVGEPTNEPPSNSAPPPVNPGYNPPIVCPVNYVFDANRGICILGASPGAPPTLEGPGSQPTPGTGSCPLGFVQQPDGRCTSTTPTTTCPQGYFLSNGQCVSNGTYDPTTGSPGGSYGTGNGGSTCGGPGQPPCSVTLTDPGSLDPIKTADPSTDSNTELGNKLDDLHQKMGDWSDQDPAKGYQSDYVSMLADWISPIPSGTCSPISTNLLGKTWVLNHCDVAEQASAILEYALWLYFAVATFMMVTGGRSDGMAH